MRHRWLCRLVTVVWYLLKTGVNDSRIILQLYHFQQKDFKSAFKAIFNCQNNGRRNISFLEILSTFLQSFRANCRTIIAFVLKMQILFKYKEKRFLMRLIKINKMLFFIIFEKFLQESLYSKKKILVGNSSYGHSTIDVALYWRLIWVSSRFLSVIMWQMSWNAMSSCLKLLVNHEWCTATLLYACNTDKKNISRAL